MSNELLAKWLKHYDPVHHGWTPDGIANGVCATSGFFFPRIKGGYNLRRSPNGLPGPLDQIAGAASHDATTIRTFPWVSHEPSTTYSYRLVPVCGRGVENLTDETVVEAVFDANGDWIGARPNPPADLRVISQSGGHFLVKWTYSPEGQQAEPAEFRVYHDSGTGHIDYQTPTASIPYRRGRLHYEYISAPFAHTTRIRWSVRAATSTGTEELNQQQAAACAQAQPPPANPAVLITVRDASV